MTGDEEPACAVTGNCEPFDEEADQLEAMCQHCGGWRYKDHPYPGNWGTWQFCEPHLHAHTPKAPAGGAA